MRINRVYKISGIRGKEDRHLSSAEIKYCLDVGLTGFKCRFAEQE